LQEPKLTITRDDVAKIKDAAFNHIHDTVPRNLDDTELQILLICKGVLFFLGYKGIDLPVEIDYEWDRHNISRK